MSSPALRQISTCFQTAAREIPSSDASSGPVMARPEASKTSIGGMSEPVC